jgi:hypothetical protein
MDTLLSNNFFNRAIMLTLLATLLTACGGGEESGNSDSSSTPSSPTSPPEYQLQFDGYLQKPASLSHLIAEVNHLYELKIRKEKINPIITYFASPYSYIHY